MNTSVSYLVNVFANGASRALGMGAGFFCFVMFARVLGSEALGQLAFVMAFTMIAGNVADFGTNTALAGSLAEHRDRDAAAWFGNYLLVRLGLAAVMLMLAVPFSLLSGDELRHALLLGCIATPFMAARFFESLFQIFERPQYAVYSALVLGICQIALCSAALLSGSGLHGYLFAFAVSQGIYFVVALRFSRSLLIPRLTWRSDYSNALLRLAMPMGFSALAMAIYSRADVFLLTHWLSSEAVGQYNAAYRLLDLGVAVAVTVALPLVPILARRVKADAQEARELCTEVLQLAATALLPAAILMTCLADVIVALIYGAEFAPAVPVLRIFAWLFVLGTYSLVASSINVAAGNMRYNYWLYPLAGVCNLAANVILIPEHGIIGAAVAAAISTCVTLCGVLWAVHGSVGRVHRGTTCLKLLLLGVAMHLYMQWLRGALPAPNAGLVAVTALALYTLFAWFFGMLPVARARALLAARGTAR